MRGVILFAHGSRDPSWSRPFEAIAAQVNANGQVKARLAYLEIMSPGLPECAAGLVADGCTHITIVPLFFAAGRHLRVDLPAQVDSLRRQWPTLHFGVSEAAGESPAIQAALTRWILELSLTP